MKKRLDALISAMRTRPKPASIPELLQAFRTELKMDRETFALRVGANARSIKRWEAKSGPPSVAMVSKWYQEFAAEMEPVAHAQAGEPGPLLNDTVRELAPPVGDRFTAAFQLRHVLERIALADEVWSLKCRIAFSAGKTVEARDVFWKLILEREKFALHCVYMDYKYLNDQDESDFLTNEANLCDVRPWRTPEASFHDLQEHFKDKAETAGVPFAKFEERVFGHKIPIALAASIGLADIPMSLLTVVYSAEGRAKYARSVDTFREQTEPLYDSESRAMIPDEERNVWHQLLPAQSKEMWSTVWAKAYEKVLNPDFLVPW